MRVKTSAAVRVKTPAPDTDARDRLVMEHVPLVKTLAQRLAQRLPSQVEMNDLISVGVLGLIDAATRYRPSTGVPFDAFARRRVNGWASKGASIFTFRSLPRRGGVTSLSYKYR